MSRDPVLPARRGLGRGTTPTNPHTQLDQQPERADMRERLAARVFALPGVRERPSAISVPGARALWLDEPAGPADAFMVGGEFAHLHPSPDLSLHAALPPSLARAAVAAGWGEVHPVARQGLLPAHVVMLYAPRDDHELDVVSRLVEAAWRHASGEGGINADDS